MNRHVDAIVIGSGAGGSVVAAELTAAGKEVLLLERGPALAADEIPNDHLRNHRQSLYGFNTEPQDDGAHPRVFVSPTGAARILAPHQPGYSTNPTVVGGGTRVNGMQSWRFHPDDFRMASKYGVPAGSSLADWPLSYGDLAPDYERAEWDIGVAGDPRPDPHAGPRRRGFPLPPVPSSSSSRWLESGAQRLGWATFTPPLLLNTASRALRPACTQCSECIGFACHVDAKNSAHNTALPQALQSGLCTLSPRSHALRIQVDGAGRVRGVEYAIRHRDGSIEQRVATARVVVVCAGAIETARLLLLSTSRLHPTGLGNHSDHLGRHLQGHYYTGAYGFTPPDILSDGRGRGVNLATTRFNHGNPGIVGGGLIANEFIKLPLQFWRTSLPPGAPRWGTANQKLMRAYYRRSVHLQSAVQEIPSPDARIQLDPRVTDLFGLPVARLSGTTHPETLRTTEFMRARCLEWLQAAGAERAWSWPRDLELSAGQHQAGTARMSLAPQDGVTDAFGRVHGHDNLFVADGSLHVTNGGYNPVLTILALAYRVSRAVVSAL